ncbi:MAG: DUF881 domain-containing protein [Actinomycetales bacterium]|nr:DUF881 domain-containing protein [Candidatus Lutibacillus vidarii]
MIPSRTGPVDASMRLLTEIMDHPLDPGYVAAAQRRTTLGELQPRARRGVAVITALVLGFALTVSAVTLRRPVTGAAKVRSDLVERILAVRAHDDQVGARISSMEAEIDQYQAAALELTGNEAISAELGRLTAATGAEAMTGPGVSLTLDDALESGVGGGSDPRNSTGFTDGRVTARDLQIVVNGLWQAGAEAMAVNGMRLTARSSIRFAGNALLVDFRPLTRPYLITAIGDPQALEPSFAATVAGGYLSALVDNYSIRAEFAAADSLSVPSATGLDLTSAQVLRGATTGTSGG